MKADIKGLFSERAQSNDEFRNKVILPTEYEFNNLKRFVDAFPDLISLDYVPIKFIALMGYFFGYPYLETEDPEIQREVYKHLVETYKQKGSRGLFEKALRYSHSDNYALGDMTYYHGDIDPAVFSITYPRDQMLRYDRSTWDRYKYSDLRTVALGIIDIETDKLNDRVETYLDALIPAGIKYGILVSKNIGGETGPVVYPYIADNDTLVCSEPSITPVYIGGKDRIEIHDNRKYDFSVWDGREVISYEQEIEQDASGAILTPIRASDRSYDANTVPDWLTPNMADKMFYGIPTPSGMPEGPYPLPEVPERPILTYYPPLSEICEFCKEDCIHKGEKI